MNKSIEFNKVQIKDDFWSEKLNVWKKTLIRTCLDKCYETGRIDNFKIAGGLMEGSFTGIYFNDSDVYKILEGAAYLLQLEKDEQLEAEIDQIISYIEAAQEDDGYLCTYYTLVEPQNKWTDMEKHEMYCGGHLIEAAIAYYQATGKEQFLAVAEKLVAHYLTIFGEDKRNWVEGHQEIELALVKLYRVTGKEQYLKFAKWLLEQRGHGHGVGMIWSKEHWGPAYCQDDVVVTDIEKAVGHAVRAAYMYTAMVDIFAIEGDELYLNALNRVWEDIHHTKMYITGGIGSSRHNEGFQDSYFLPNESAYAETCAAIGNVFFNHQMNLLTKDAKYADVIERSIYNGILSGISLDGLKFFYVNPLASVGDHHRKEWFDCSCCPSNLARFLPSIGGYIFAKEESTLVINQYIGCTYEDENCVVEMQSGFPWDGNVIVKIRQNTQFNQLKLRVPAWASEFTLSKNDVDVTVVPDDTGYISIAIGAESSVQLTFDAPLRKMKCHEKVKPNQGKVAFEKGPLVYCAEKVDNKEYYYDELQVGYDYTYRKTWNEAIGAECITLHQRNLPHWNIQKKVPLTLVPYFAWDNREPGFMKVWLDEKEADSLYYD